MNPHLRVAVFTDTFPAQSETFIAGQVEGLLDLGHRARIYADRSPRAGEFRESECAGHDLQALATYFRIPKASGYWEMPVFPPWGRTWLPGASVPIINAKRLLRALPTILHSILFAPGLARKALDPQEYGYRARSLSTLYRVSQLLPAKGEHDVAHAHFGPVGDNVRFVRDLWRVPLVVSFHGYDLGAWPREKGREVYSKLFRDADLITANSGFTLEKLEALGCPPRKIRVLHMGLDLARFTFRERAMPGDGQIRLLSVGRLVEKKGFEYSIRAVARVKERYPGVRYGIVGDGPLREHLQATAREFGVGEQVTFYGRGSDGVVRRKMEEAHIFLAPSVTARNGDTEGQGLVLQEAQACGLPVLATGHNGFPEGMLPGRSGFLVPERSVEGLAERLEFMFQRPEKWAEWGRAGRKHVEESYDIKKLSAQLEALYRQAISAFTGRGRGRRR